LLCKADERGLRKGKGSVVGKIKHHKINGAETEIILTNPKPMLNHIKVDPQDLKTLITLLEIGAEKKTVIKFIKEFIHNPQR
jgi:hypothetical protein